MAHEEIIAMAREASSMERLPWNGEWIFRSKKELMAFAALVAAKEREACGKARAGKPRVLPMLGVGSLHGEQQFCFEKGFREGAAAVRAAIRARGTKEGV